MWRKYAKKIHKFGCLYIIILSCFTLTGCENNSPEANNSDNTSTTSQEQNETKDQKVIEPPEEGWTIESLVNTVTFFGKELSYPITLEQFGDDFSINTAEPLSDKINLGKS